MVLEEDGVDRLSKRNIPVAQHRPYDSNIESKRAVQIGHVTLLLILVIKGHFQNLNSLFNFKSLPQL